MFNRYFFSNLKTSITGEDFVATFSSRGLGSALWYQAQLLFLMGVVTTLVLLAFLVTFLQSFSISSLVQTYYPADLVIELKDGMVSTNVTEPYVIPIDGSAPYTYNEETHSPNTDLRDTIIINTSATDPLEALENYGATALITENRLLVQDDNEIRVIELTDMTFTLTEAAVLDFIAMITPYAFGALVVAALMLPIFMTIGAMIGTMITALLFALVILLIAHVRELRFSYSLSYRLTLYLLTVPVLFSSTLGWFIGGGFLLQLVMFTVLAILFIHRAPDASSPPAPKEATTTIPPQSTENPA